MKPCLSSRLLVWAASRLLPGERRVDWLAEWRGELWAVSASHSVRAWKFALGSFFDAWHLRAQSRRGLEMMNSPAGCLAVLALLALLASSVFSKLAGRASQATYAHANLVFAATVALSAGLLNCVWRWEIAIPKGIRPARGPRIRWHLFLAAKFAAVLIPAHQATVHLVLHGLPPQAVLTGCIAGFLWVLREQRQRCPICLHRLARPVRVGTYAQTFLGWNGVESICPKGHGALYTGYASATSRESRSEWMGMDATWAGLFPAQLFPHPTRDRS